MGEVRGAMAEMPPDADAGMPTGWSTDRLKDAGRRRHLPIGLAAPFDLAR